MKRRKPSFKTFLAALSIFPLLLVVWILCLPILRGFESGYKSPPFPDNLDGKRAIWVPDKQLVPLAKSIDMNTIEFIELVGGGDTAMPPCITVLSRRNIDLIMNGLRHAQRRLHVRQPMGASHDLVTIHFRPSSHRDDIHIAFFADVYEETILGDFAGTISPEFQDALRSLGVSKRDDLNPVLLYLFNLPFQVKIF